MKLSKKLNSRKKALKKLIVGSLITGNKTRAGLSRALGYCPTYFCGTISLGGRAVDELLEENVIRMAGKQKLTLVMHDALGQEEITTSPVEPAEVAAPLIKIRDAVFEFEKEIERKVAAKYEREIEDLKQVRDYWKKQFYSERKLMKDKEEPKKYFNWLK